MKKEKLIWVILVAIFLIVGVPIIINESYKHGVVYITMWNAADVLSYYGTLLSTVATIGVLVITIQFTKKQIRRESYYNSQIEKWRKFDIAISTALQQINPINVIEIATQSTIDNINATITSLQQYSLKSKTSVDVINSSINADEYRKLQPLLKDIIDAICVYCEIVDKYIFQYGQLELLRMRGNSLGILRYESQNLSPESQASIEQARKIVEETDGITMESITSEQKKLGLTLVELRDKSYSPLLYQKQKVFSQIYAEIESAADSFLSFGRRQ